MILDTWAARWNVPAAALADLRALMVASTIPQEAAGTSEAAVQSMVRVEASQKGARLFRNNVGAGTLADGSFVRWGLANDSKQLNEQVKSADLIGLRPVLITEWHVGKTIGQFISRECKHAGWKFNPKDKREVAQERWARMVNALGGDARFATGRGTL